MFDLDRPDATASLQHDIHFGALVGTPEVRLGTAVEQPDCLNACVSVRTEASPEELLRCLVRVEELHHRQRSVRWGPRTLDLDLLLYGDRSMSSPQLTVPHPRMSERCFVLVPLCEIAPDLLHPLSGRAFAEYCLDLDCQAQVRPAGALKARRLDS